MLKLSDLKPGDKIKGFEGFGSLFVECTHGKHLLDGQCADQPNDTLVGMSRKE